MHIAEGVLSAPVLISGAAVAAVAVAAGLRRIDSRSVMPAALLGAAFFVASLIHVPVGPSSVHLILNGLLGVMLGMAAVPVIFTGLLLQALLFGYGGLTVLGVNTVSMGLGAVCSGLLFHGLFSVLRRSAPSVALPASGFVAGALGVAVAGVLTAAALAFSEEGFGAAAAILLTAHLPVMLIEGVVTAATLGFIARVRPEMLPQTVRDKL